jgi:hypothetical protein
MEPSPLFHEGEIHLSESLKEEGSSEFYSDFSPRISLSACSASG